jgi:LacI family transcriptional regulator
LIKNGFKKIAIILGVKDLDISEKRFKGYQNAMNAYNLHIPDDYIQYSNLVKDNIKHALDTLLNLDSPPDAIFTAFIKDGIEVINQAKKLNIKIPSQLGVAAFGEDEIAKHIEPSLTTYNSNPVKVGEESISILLDLIKSPTQGNNIKVIINGSLLERESSLNE